MKRALEPAAERTILSRSMVADGSMSVDCKLLVVNDVGSPRQSAEPIGSLAEAERGVERAGRGVDGQELIVAAGHAKVASLLTDLDGLR